MKIYFFLFLACSIFLSTSYGSPKTENTGDQNFRLIEMKVKKGTDGNFSYDFTYPEINSTFKNKSVRKKVNATILETINRQLPDSPNTKDTNVQKVTVHSTLEFANSVALSFSISIENTESAMIDSESFLFDLNTGERVDLNSQIDPAKNEDFYKMLKAEFRKKINPADTRDCEGAYSIFNESSKNNRITLPWTLKKNSVYFIQSDLPQATRACGLELT